MNYHDLLSRADLHSGNETLIGFLSAELPILWVKEYERVAGRSVNIVIVKHNALTYLFDYYTELEVKGFVPVSKIEDRVVGAFGTSSPAGRARESGRMRCWIGPSRTVFGPGRDKGHFVAHTLGGIVDGFEMNLFSQDTALNRGWSQAGKSYRRMEAYCAARLGTFYFTRPVYQNQTSTPAMIEVGILMTDGTLWVETFGN